MMIRLSHRLIAATALCAATLIMPMTAHALDEAEKEEIGAFIREYLIENPEVMIEVQQALESKRQAAQQEQAGTVIAAETDALFNGSRDIVVGNPDGEITIVEFFDYNCGYCQRAHADMQAIVAADDDIRFVLKEWPVLGEDSIAAHRVSMAFGDLMPERYAEFQDALIMAERANEAQAVAIALELGADEDALREAIADPEIETTIRETYRLADALGMSGTPSYIIGNEAIFGALGAEVLMAKADNLRACGETVC